MSKKKKSKKDKKNIKKKAEKSILSRFNRNMKILHDLLHKAYIPITIKELKKKYNWSEEMWNNIVKREEVELITKQWAEEDRE